MRLIKIFVGWVCWPCLVPCKKAMLQWCSCGPGLAQGWPRVFPVHKVRECLLSYYDSGGLEGVSRLWSRHRYGGWRGHSLLSWCGISSSQHLSYVTTFTVSIGTVWHYDTLTLWQCYSVTCVDIVMMTNTCQLVWWRVTSQYCHVLSPLSDGVVQ